MNNELSRADARKFAALFDAIQAIDNKKVIPLNKRHKYSVVDAVVGGMVSDSNKELLRVDEVAIYKEKGASDTWSELRLTSLTTGQIHFIEIEEEDGVTKLTRSKAKLSSTYFNPSLDIDRVESIANSEQSIDFQGTLYKYEDDYTAWYKVEGKEDQLVWIVDFVGIVDGVDHYITVEFWYEDPKDEDGDGETVIWHSVDSDIDDFEVVLNNRT